MSNETATNNDEHRHQHIVIGDILLHSELNITIIQVVIHSLSVTSPLTVDKPIIHRLSANSSGTNGFPCDLKNTSPDKVTPERIKKSLSSRKKLIRMHKAGLALVKEFKSKVVTSNHNDSKSVNMNTDNERTDF
jgi:hypothetical protein